MHARVHEPGRELDVLARGEPLVEPADPLDRLAPEPDVAAVRELEPAEELSRPVGDRTATRLEHPVGVQRGDVERPGHQLVVPQAVAHRPHPAGVDDVVRVAHRDRVGARPRMPTLRQCATPGPVRGVHHPHPGVTAGVLVHDRLRPVGRAVVHDDHLPRPVPLLRQQGVELDRGSVPRRPSPGSRRSAPASSRLRRARRAGRARWGRGRCRPAPPARARSARRSAPGRPRRALAYGARRVARGAVAPRGRRPSRPSASAQAAIGASAGTRDPPVPTVSRSAGQVAAPARGCRWPAPPAPRAADRRAGTARAARGASAYTWPGSVVAGRSTTLGSFAFRRWFSAARSSSSSFHHSTNANEMSGRAAASSSAVSKP